MAATSQNLRKEFWQPPLRMPAPPAARSLEVCPQCLSACIPNSQFCHSCGARRGTKEAVHWIQMFDFQVLRRTLGLTAASLAAFLIGIACALAALGTGLVFTMNTFDEWHAVQMWRAEWLLAAAAAFLAGILLKR
jgi:hypothetical protein